MSIVYALMDGSTGLAHLLRADVLHAIGLSIAILATLAVRAHLSGSNSDASCLLEQLLLALKSMTSTKREPKQEKRKVYDRDMTLDEFPEADKKKARDALSEATGEDDPVSERDEDMNDSERGGPYLRTELRHETGAADDTEELDETWTKEPVPTPMRSSE